MQTLKGWEIEDGRIIHGVVRLVSRTADLVCYSSALLSFSDDSYSATLQNGEIFIKDRSGEEIVAINYTALVIVSHIDKMTVGVNGWLLRQNMDPRHTKWLQRQFVRIDQGQASSASDRGAYFKVDPTLEGQEVTVLSIYGMKVPLAIDQNNNLVPVQEKYPFASRTPLIMPGDD